MWALILNLFSKKCEFCKRNNFRVCPNCLTKISELRKSQDGIPYFLSYQDEKIRKLIWKFKYNNELIIATDLAPLIGDFIYEQIENNLELQNKKIYVIPAPITNDPTRYRLKNHMSVMAQAVKKYLFDLDVQVEISDCLKKTGHKRSALIFGKKKRIIAIEKNIVLVKEPPTDGIIFIIDDVTTTGTTLKKIRRLVLNNLSETKKKAFVQTVALAH